MSNLSANAQRLEDWLVAEYPGQLHLCRSGEGLILP